MSFSVRPQRLDQELPAAPPRRRGARQRSDIPAKILVQLNRGQLATANLMEWLGVDMLEVLRTILPQVGLGHARKELLARARIENIKEAGVTKRLAWIGTAIFEVVQNHPDRIAIEQALVSHPSDIVRQWATYMVAANSKLDLAARLEATRRFASDDNMTVRECAWMTFRPYIVYDLVAGLQLLRPLVIDQDPNVRRFAVEVTRPRSVWGVHIPLLKRSPHVAFPLINRVRADPSRYVQIAVSNWLNDASKSRPEWVETVCRRWRRLSASPATLWIVRRALRSIHQPS